MEWLARHAWWGILLIALTLVIFGLTDMAAGAAADPAIPMGLTGMTIEQLEAESPAAYRMFDFMTRSNGWSLVLVGLFTTAVLVIPFRRGERWSWWTLWLVPAWAAVVPVFYLVAGVEPDQPPPPPLVSGPIVAVLGALILLVSARRFFGSDSPR